MPEEIVPKEQMEVFNRGQTDRRPSLPPRRMAEAPMEEAISEVPMEEEVMDSGLSRSDPKTLLADFGTFLIGLPNEKITFMKSFVLDNPPITEAVSDTLQMPPEDLNDIFNALLGDGEASKRLVEKFGGEEAMAMEEPMQPRPLAQPQPQMPMQAEQPRFEKGGIQARGKGISEKLLKSAESSTLAVLNETENVSQALSNFEQIQDEALNAGLSMEEIYKLTNTGDRRATQSFLDEGGSKLTIATKYLPFTEAWRASAKVRAIGGGLEKLGDKIGKEIDIISDGVKEFLGDVEEGYKTYGEPLLDNIGVGATSLLEGGVTGQGIDNTLAGRTDLMKALSTGEKSGLFGTGSSSHKVRGSINPERAAFRDTRGLVSRQ